MTGKTFEQAFRESPNLILTPQEHKLLGSTAREQYTDKYTPCFVQDGYSAEEVGKARRERGKNECILNYDVITEDTYRRVMREFESCLPDLEPERTQEIFASSEPEDRWYTLTDKITCFTLEPLDKNGKTRCDPEIVWEYKKKRIQMKMKQVFSNPEEYFSR